MARLFNGSTDLFDAGSAAVLDDANGTQLFTMSAWVNKTVSTGFGRILSKRDFNTGAGKNFGEDTNSVSASLRLQVTRATTSANAVAAANTLPSGVWRFVACTYDPNDSLGPHLFVATPGGTVSEASYASTPTAGSGTTSSDATGALNIGGPTTGSGQSFNGSIADVRYWAGVILTAEQLQTAMRGAHVRRDKLIGWWPLWGVSSPEPDWSGYNNNGTLTGTVRSDHPPGYSAVSYFVVRVAKKTVATTTQVQQGRTRITNTSTKTINGVTNLLPRPTVTTRFYVTQAPPDQAGFTGQDSGTGWGYPINHGAWDAISGTIIYSICELQLYPEGIQTNSGTTVGSTLADRDVLLGRWISPPMKAYDFTASDTIEWVLGVSGSAGLNGVFHVHVWVYQGDGETERGNLLVDSIGAAAWPALAEGRGEGRKNLNALSALNGDRLGIEVGFRANATATNQVGRLYFGGAGGSGTGGIIITGGIPVQVDDSGSFSDITSGSTDVTTRRGWFELISGTDLFTITDTNINGVSKILNAAGVQQLIFGIARIQVTNTITITGKADVLVTVTKTQTGKTRIGIVSSQGQTGHSRIKNTYPKDQLGVANILSIATSARTTLGKADIKKTTSQTSTGVTRIGLVTSKNQTGLSRIKNTYTKDQTGVSNLHITTTAGRTTTGKADVLNTTSQTHTGGARIGLRTTQDHTGITRLKNTYSKDQSGTSNIAVSSQAGRSILGKANIFATTSQTHPGTGNLVKPVGQVLTGIANIFAHTAKDQLGKARIVVTGTTLQELSGVGNILHQIAVYQLGLAHILERAVTRRFRVRK